MDFSTIQDLYIPIVLLACLTLGYLLKAWVKDLDNKYIPAILAVSGAVLGCVAVKPVTLESVVYGAITGLGSTGLHQAFTKIIENK